jgi:hypothetical protein
MALPKAVQQQVEEADRFVAEMNFDQTGQPPETNLNTDPPPNPVEEPQVNTVSQEQTKQIDSVPDEKWSQKYHTLKGMYDAEVPRLHSQVRELNTQVQTLIGEVERAKVQQIEPMKQVESLITEQDREAFGPDLIDLIERAAQSKIANSQGKESELVNRIKELENQLGNVSERQVVSDKDRFLDGLSQQVPDWEILNTDQGFLGWLQEVDPVYGMPRQLALTNAYENLEVTRVSNIFKAYKSLLPAKTEKPQLNPELQRQVAPTRSRSASQPVDQQNDRYFNENEIAQFYDDWRRGLIDNDEAVKMEKDIHTAITAGRIR